MKPVKPVKNMKFKKFILHDPHRLHD